VFDIPWNKPNLTARERDLVVDAVESSWISGGHYIERFEHELAAMFDVPTVLTVANGTAAIHLAYLAIGLAPGDEVVVPGFAFQAAANMALNMSAKPVFAEVDVQSWCLTAEAVEQVITPKTRAVVAVHTYGNACEMDAIMALCRPRGIVVIEDAAESFGTRYQGRLTGAIADIGTFSFQATKTITTGEGGMVITRRPELIEPMQLYRSHGMLRTRYLHEVAGFNFRLTNIQAAMGCAQLERYGVLAAARAKMFATYRSALSNQAGLRLQHFPDSVDPVVWAIAVKLDAAEFDQGRDSVLEQLAKAGIEGRPGFYPPAAMPALYGPTPALPICDDVGRQVLTLPSYTSLSAGEIERVCNTLLSLRRRP
jgi:perosamine synthetase